MENIRGLGRRGNSLVMTLMAVVIGAIAMTALFKVVGTSFKATKAVSALSEYQMVRDLIYNEIDCAATFGANNPNSTTLCNTTSAVNGQNSAGLYLRLRRKTQDASVKFLTGPLNSGVAAIGDWTIRATCSQSEQSLVIRAARVSGGTFEKNYSGQLADWDNPNGLLFGGTAGGMPLCYGSSSGGNPGAPKRFAVLRASFSIFNNNTEHIQVDLTQAAVTVESSLHASLSGSYRSEIFSTTGTTVAAVSMEYADVRINYYNVSASNPASITYPSPGKVRVRLVALGDIGGGVAPFGAVRMTITVYQL